MRILACFSRNRNVVLDESDPLAQVNHKDRKKDRKFDRATKSVPDPNVFVPTSIAELHPEYAHAEPYCFSARTDSARVIVEKMHETKGQPAPDRAEILKEEGLVVVRGPSYNATKAAHLVAEANARSKSVPLTIETPTTADDSYVESDDSASDEHVDENVDENVDDQNINTNRKSFKSSVSQTRKSLDSKTAVSEDNSKPKKSPAKSFRLKSRKSKNSLKRQPTSENILQPRNSNVQQASNLSAQDTSAIPTPPASDHSSEATEEDIQNHMDNTPQELLAPIMVPRMSGAFPDSNRILSETKKQSRSIIESPAISSETWLPSDSSQRYEDVEGDNSSGLISMSTVGKEKVIHKATYSPARAPLSSSGGITPVLPSITPVLPDASPQSTVSQSMRSRRKSKPYVSTSGTIDTSAPVLASPESIAMDRIDEGYMFNETGTIPEPAALSRQISVGVMSDDIQVIDTPALSSTTEDNGVMPLITPSPREAARQRIHDDPLDLPSATAQPQGIIRRASSTKRKTVSFHTASPTIIEPNLRAPSSVPRSALLSKDLWRTSEVPRQPASALKYARDSVALAASPVPQTMDTNTISITRKQDRQDRQDSFTSDDTFQERSSRRMSTRVLVKDRNELKEASKRQSRAVAAAMADQIKGVPKSAMLAFTENEIELADSFEESDQDSSLSSLRRRSRASKSIRMPEFIPGVVPAPPPPPPFVPDTPRARSIRAPPPPPASPLPH